MKKITIFLIFLLVFSSRISAVQTNHYTFNEFIRNCIEQNSYLQARLSEALEIRYGESLLKPSRDLVLSAEGGLYIETGSSSGNDQIVLSAGRSFPRTGTKVSAHILIKENADPSVSLYAGQALLGSGSGRKGRLQDKEAAFKTRAAFLQVQEAYEQYYASMMELYINWYSASLNLMNMHKAYSESIRILGEIQDRQKSGIAREDDVQRIQLQILTHQELITKASNLLVNLQRSVRSASDLIVKTDIIPSDPVPDFNLTFSNKIQPGTRTEELFDMETKLASLGVQISRQNLIPDVGLEASYSTSPDGSLLYTGFSFGYSVPPSVSGTSYKRAKALEEKKVLSVQDARRQYVLDTANMKDELSAQHKLIRIAEQKLSSSQTIYRFQKRDFDTGRAELKDLINASNQVQDQELDLILTKLHYMELLIDWASLTDILAKELE